MRLLNFSILH